MPTIREWPPDDRPRERLAAHPPSALSSRELLALLLGSGGAGRTVLDLASEVLVRYGGSLRRLGAAEPGELATAPGIGPVRDGARSGGDDQARCGPSSVT